MEILLALWTRKVLCGSFFMRYIYIFIHSFILKSLPGWNVLAQPACVWRHCVSPRAPPFQQNRVFCSWSKPTTDSSYRQSSTSNDQSLDRPCLLRWLRVIYLGRQHNNNSIVMARLTVAVRALRRDWLALLLPTIPLLPAELRFCFRYSSSAKCRCAPMLNISSRPTVICDVCLLATITEMRANIQCRWTRPWNGKEAHSQKYWWVVRRAQHLSYGNGKCITRLKKFISLKLSTRQTRQRCL